MSRLSDTLQRTLDECRLTAAQLERSAGLPAMSVKSIHNGCHPRADRFAKLLSALPSLSDQVELLIAYTLDDSPETFTADLEQVLRLHLYEAARISHHITDDAPAVLRESAARNRPASIATRAREVLGAMHRRLDDGDTILAEWLADTGELLAAPHLSSEDYTKE